MTTPIHPFVMFPSRIWNLPGVTLQLLKFYEKIFQFWHQGYECFVSNKILMEYSGMSSPSTLSNAFTYFEKHGEMKRIMKGGRRYIIPPTPRVVTEGGEEKEAANGDLSTEGLAPARGGSRCGEGGGLAPARDNNINIIIKNNKSFCLSDEQKKNKTVYKSKSKEDWKAENQKKHTWGDKKKESPLADVTKQSTSFDPERHSTKSTFDPNAAGYKAFLDAFPAHKRRVERNREQDAAQTTELSTGASVQSEVPARSEPDPQGAEVDAGGGKDNPSPVRSRNRVMAPVRIHTLLEKAGLAC